MIIAIKSCYLASEVPKASSYHYGTHGGEVVVANIGGRFARFGYGGASQCEHVISAIDPQVNTSYYTTVLLIKLSLYQSTEDDPRRPVERGVIKDWDALERLLEGAYQNVLQTSSKSHPLLLADAPDTSDRDREKMAELLFEKFEIPAYFVGTDSVLSVYSTGFVLPACTSTIIFILLCHTYQISTRWIITYHICL